MPVLQCEGSWCRSPQRARAGSWNRRASSAFSVFRLTPTPSFAARKCDASNRGSPRHRERGTSPFPSGNRSPLTSRRSPPSSPSAAAFPLPNTATAFSATSSPGPLAASSPPLSTTPNFASTLARSRYRARTFSLRTFPTYRSFEASGLRESRTGTAYRTSSSTDFRRIYRRSCEGR